MPSPANTTGQATRMIFTVCGVFAIKTGLAMAATGVPWWLDG